MTEPDLNLLIALDALLAEGSVAGAARRLGLSSSAMSRTLGRLRATIGDPLLVRAGRQMVLTPQAEALRERSQQALNDARQLLRPSTASLDIATLQRTFTLRTNEGFVEAFGAALIAAVRKQAPLVQLCFSAKGEKSSQPLREGFVDLEIGVLTAMGPEVRIQALFRDRFVGVVRQDHPLTQEMPVSAQHYAAAEHVVASRRGITRGPVDDALAVLGFERSIAAVVPGFPAALAVARASDLIALLPLSFMHHQPKNAGLTVFELPVKTPPITVSQMWHPRLEADAAHRWLRQQVLAVCRQHSPSGF